MTSSDSPQMVVAGLGAATAVGRCALASVAAVRAGISGFSAHPYMVDAVGLPMHVAMLPWLDGGLRIERRIGDALVSCVREAIEPLGLASTPRPRIALMVNLPLDRPGMPAEFGQSVVARVNSEFKELAPRIGFMTLGHAGGLIGLQTAMRWLTANPDWLCVVAGADSYLEPDVLEWLERTDQLHGAGERNNAWGFVPGEGAGAVLLSTAETARKFGVRVLAKVQGAGVGREADLIGTGRVCTGLGLTEAIRDALASQRHGEIVSDVYCDMNGEPYRADEYAFAVTRVRERFAAASEFVAPADCWGDIGAASGPMLVVLACIAGVRRFAKGSSALIWASSVTGERGAALLETVEGTA